MTKTAGDDEAELGTAAQQLEDSLREYRRAAHELLRLPLDSRKNVERAAESVARVVRLEEELAQRVSGLVAAVASLRDRQQATAQEVERRVGELATRQAELSGLLGRLAGLAGDVKEISGLLDAVKRNERSFREVTERIGEVAEQAHGFSSDAQAHGFADLAAEGHAIRQQLLSVKNKAGLLRGKLPEA